MYNADRFFSFNLILGDFLDLTWLITWCNCDMQFKVRTFVLLYSPGLPISHLTVLHVRGIAATSQSCQRLS
jgi:hypothetical protein